MVVLMDNLMEIQEHFYIGRYHCKDKQQKLNITRNNYKKPFD